MKKKSNELHLGEKTEIAFACPELVIYNNYECVNKDAPKTLCGGYITDDDKKDNGLKFNSDGLCKTTTDLVNGGKMISSHDQNEIEKRISEACKFGSSMFLCTDPTSQESEYMPNSINDTLRDISITKFMELNEFINNNVDISKMDIEGIVYFMYNHVFSKLPPIVMNNIAIIRSSDDLTSFRCIDIKTSDKLEQYADKISSCVNNLESRNSPFIIYFKMKDSEYQPFIINTNISIKGFIGLCERIIPDLPYYKDLFTDLNTETLINNFSISMHNILKMDTISGICENLEVYDKYIDIENIINKYIDLRERASTAARIRNGLKDYFETTLGAQPLQMDIYNNSFIRDDGYAFTAYNIKGILFVLDVFKNHVRVYAPEKEPFLKLYELSNLYVDIPLDENIFLNIEVFLKGLYSIEYNKIYGSEEE